MRKLIILFLCLFTLTVEAQISQSPDQVLFSTAIGTMHTIDSFLVSPSENGISLFVYNDSLEQYSFVRREFFNRLNTMNSKVNDSVLIIQSTLGKLHFVSLKNLPQMTFLGTVDLNRPFADYILIENSLYIAGYFDGILRYDISNYTQANFVDSSMLGILITQLSADSSYLYALDEYNGLLRYELNSSAFPTFIDYLYVPLRAFAYTQIDSLFYLHLIEGGLLVGDYNRPDSNNIIDSVQTSNQIQSLYYTDSQFLITDNRNLLVINRDDNTDTKSFLLNGVSPKGLWHPYRNTTTLMLPSDNGGLSFISFDTSLLIEEGLEYNGNVDDMLITDSKLFISSNSEPIRVFHIDTTGETMYDYTLYENLNQSGQLEHNGDSLFALYPEIEKLALIVNADEPDSTLWENSITTTSSTVRNMYYNGEQLFDNALIFIEQPYSIELLLVSDSGFLAFASRWNFISDITSFAVKDSVAVVTNRKNECEIYRINNNYEKEYHKSISLSGTASKSIFHNDLLYLFQDQEMYIIDFSTFNNIFIDTVLNIPFDVIDAVIVENQMFTVGALGITHFDLNGTIPEVIETGGLPGNAIHVDSNVIAIHDNETIMLYYHDLPLSEDDPETAPENFSYLLQNYPNPFNLETIIQYRLPQASDVQISIYNILGQKITTLIDANQEAGSHSVSWDGTNASGNVIASGIYFYKLKTEQSAVSKKMVLIK